mgnify:CR=1 FL=1
MKIKIVKLKKSKNKIIQIKGTQEEPSWTRVKFTTYEEK